MDLSHKKLENCHHSIDRLKGDQASFIGEIGWNKADIDKASVLIQQQTDKLSALENTFASRTAQHLTNQIQLHTSYDGFADFEEAIDELSDSHRDLVKDHNKLRLSTNLRLNRLVKDVKKNQLLLSTLIIIFSFSVTYRKPTGRKAQPTSSAPRTWKPTVCTGNDPPGTLQDVQPSRSTRPSSQGPPRHAPRWPGYGQSHG